MKILLSVIIILALMSCTPSIPLQQSVSNVEGKVGTVSKIGEYENFDILMIRPDANMYPLFILKDKTTKEVVGANYQQAAGKATLTTATIILNSPTLEQYKRLRTIKDDLLTEAMKIDDQIKIFEKELGIRK